MFINYFCAGIKHFDVKAEKFLMSSNLTLKLSDFGFATVQSSRNQGISPGTAEFTAPKIGLGHEAKFVSGLYSFAMTALQVLTREYPTTDAIEKQIEDAVNMHASLSWSAWSDLKQLLLKCSEYRPPGSSSKPERYRATADTVSSELQCIMADLGGDPRSLTTTNVAERLKKEVRSIKSTAEDLASQRIAKALKGNTIHFSTTINLDMTSQTEADTIVVEKSDMMPLPTKPSTGPMTATVAKKTMSSPISKEVESLSLFSSSLAHSTSVAVLTPSGHLYSRSLINVGSIKTAADIMSFLWSLVDEQSKESSNKSFIYDLLDTINTLQDTDKQINKELIDCCDIFVILILSSKGKEIMWRLLNSVKLLSSIDANKVKLGTCGACEAVTRALVDHVDYRKVAKYGCLAIIGMFDNNEINRDKLGACGACEAITKALNIHMYNVEIVESCCRAIMNLSLVHTNRVKLGTCGACEAVTRALNVHINNVEVARNGCSAIYNISLNDAGVEKFGSCGVCEAITRVLRVHIDNAEVVKLVCGAIMQLSRISRNRENLGACGACGAVTAALTVHVDDVAIVEKGFGAMVNMMHQNIANRNKLRLCGACEVVTRVLTVHIDNAVVAWYGCMLVMVMSENNDANIDKLGSCGACEAVTRALTAHINNVEVAVNSCGALWRLAGNKVQNCSRLTSCGAFLIVQKALLIHKDHVDIARRARFALNEMYPIILPTLLWHLLRHPALKHFFPNTTWIV